MTEADLYKKITTIAAKQLNISSDLITGESSAQNIPSWDSLNHMQIIVEIENELKIRFSFEDMTLMKNVNSLVALAFARMSQEKN